MVAGDALSVVGVHVQCRVRTLASTGVNCCRRCGTSVALVVVGSETSAASWMTRLAVAVTVHIVAVITGASTIVQGSIAFASCALVTIWSITGLTAIGATGASA